MDIKCTVPQATLDGKTRMTTNEMKKIRGRI